MGYKWVIEHICSDCQASVHAPSCSAPTE
jgi:hypothetical protein